MYYLYGNPNRSLPEQFFTTTVLLRDVVVDNARDSRSRSTARFATTRRLTAASSQSPTAR